MFSAHVTSTFPVHNFESPQISTWPQLVFSSGLSLPSPFSRRFSTHVISIEKYEDLCLTNSHIIFREWTRSPIITLREVRKGSKASTATHIHMYTLLIHTKIVRACTCNAVVGHSYSLLTLSKGPAALCWYGEMRKQNCVLEVRHEFDGNNLTGVIGAWPWSTEPYYGQLICIENYWHTHTHKHTHNTNFRPRIHMISYLLTGNQSVANDDA